MIHDKSFIKRRRHLVSIGYGGGGTKTEFFSSKPKPAFEEVHELYFTKVLNRSKSTPLEFIELNHENQTQLLNEIKRKMVKQRKLYYGRFACIGIMALACIFYLYNL